MAVQRNIFCDSALQAMAYTVLGSVFEKNPKLNKPELYINVEFGVNNNNNWNNFKCVSEPVWKGSLSKLSISFDSVVEPLGVRIEELITTTKVVLGTLRVYATLNTELDELSLSLMWIEQIRE